MACDIHLEAVKIFRAPIVATQKANMGMSRSDLLSPLLHHSVRSRSSLMVTTGSSLGRRGTVYLQGALRAPLDGELRRTVRGLLRRGDRLIVLDLRWRATDRRGRRWRIGSSVQHGGCGTGRVAHRPLDRPGAGGPAACRAIRDPDRRRNDLSCRCESCLTARGDAATAFPSTLRAIDGSHRIFARVPRTASSVWRQCP